MGKVYLIGAGPGDPELLTLKAARLLAGAEIVLHDALVSNEVLAMSSPAAELINVGKRAGHKLLTQDEINALLVSYAKSRESVIRLKGGDPSIFGRAGEEIEALRKAGVDCEIVPGVTAALGAAAVAGISLTDRRIASQILLSTFSHRVDADLPCVIVSNATSSRQEVRWSSVGRLSAEERLPAPALLIVGRVASRDVQGLGESFWGSDQKDRVSQQPSVI